MTPSKYEPLVSVVARFRRFFYSTQTLTLDLRDYGSIDSSWEPITVTLHRDPADPFKAQLRLHLRRDADATSSPLLAVGNRAEAAREPA